MRNNVIYTPTDKYFSDLIEWLNESLDDGWGVKFKDFSKEDQNDVVESFTSTLQDDLQNESAQYIREKYLIAGACGIFRLKQDHFIVEVFNPFKDKYCKIKFDK